ncbi:MAG: ABC transporter permease [Saprospiraceae bacterium]|nr:ABC transporter permease [Saprospiraceae bacterium]
MLGIYLKHTFRALWRSRGYTLLNIAGLAIGLSAAWLVWQYVDFEYSHDRDIPNREHIYRVVSKFEDNDDVFNTNSGCPEPVWRAAEQLAGIEQAVPVRDMYTLSILPEGAKKSFNDMRRVGKTTPTYFELVPHRWLAGSAATALSKPDQVVLTRSRAEKYFPRHSPEEMLGKTVQYETFSDTLRVEVVGVVEDLGFPTTFHSEDLLSITVPKEDNWRSVNSNQQVWLVLKNGADATAVEKSLNELADHHTGDQLKRWNMKRQLALQPLAKVHFSPEYASHIRAADPRVLGVLGAVAIFLLALACINYINLSTAQIPMRAREIGVRKTLGGRSAGIVSGFLLETAVTCLLAVVLAALLTYWAFGYFKDDLPVDVLRFASWQKTGLFLFYLVTGVSLLAGLYPGWLASRFQAVSLLRGQFSGQSLNRGARGTHLRWGLIIFQFFVAQVFIIGALVVGLQLDFMRHSDLGFDKEAVLTMEQPINAYRNPALKNKLPVLAELLQKMPEVQEVALGDPLLSSSYTSNNHTLTDEKGEKTEVNMYRKLADEKLMELYRLPLLAGRKLMPGDSARAYVINETAVKAYGLGSPEAAIGKVLSEDNGPGEAPTHWQVVGVVTDYHTMGFSEKIYPTALLYNPAEWSTLNVRLASKRPADWQPALQKIETAWQGIYPGETFEAKFYDETLADIYEADLSLARFVRVATGIAVLISCLGLFGLATFMAWRRNKEIGIRKVLGASTASVVRLLSREFLTLVFVGFLLAAPVALYFLRQWLDGYAFRIELSWWMFAGAGAVAVAVAFLTVGYQSIKAALANPAHSLKSE